MNQEIINVLNYPGEKLGIAIDWTSDNVWPQGWIFWNDIDCLSQ